MAATNVYARIAKLPYSGSFDREVVEYSNVQATPADFYLGGGTYAVDVVMATPGTVTLNKRGANDVTFVAVGTSTGFSGSGANAPVIVQLGPGIYRLVVA